MKQIKIYYCTLLLIFILKLSYAQSQSNICISGKLVDQKNVEAVLRNDAYNFTPEIIIASTTTNDSSYFCLNFKISKSQVLLLWNNPFYITPGDSVYAIYTGHRFEPKKIEFFGRNAENYNYFMMYYNLRRSLPFKNFRYNFNNGLTNYLDSLNINKNILLNQLTDFSQKNRLQPDFKTFATNQIVYEYYALMLAPIVSKKIEIGQIPSSYSLILDKIILQNDNILKDNIFADVAKKVILYKKLKSNKSLLQLINENSTGLTKDFLLVDYAYSVINNFDSKDSLETKLLFEKIDKGISNPIYRNYYIPLKDQLIKSLAPIPKEVLLTALIDSVGHKLLFKDLLAKSKNKIIILDFWASWCGPCRTEMPKLNQLKQKFNNQNVEFVYLSLDKTENEWRNGLEMTKIPGNHYMVIDESKSALKKYLKISQIPRYVIINQSGKLEKIKSNGPVQGADGLMEQINKLLINK